MDEFDTPKKARDHAVMSGWVVEEDAGGHTWAWSSRGRMYLVSTMPEVGSTRWYWSLTRPVYSDEG